MLFLWALFTTVPGFAGLLPDSRALPLYDNVLHDPKHSAPIGHADDLALTALFRRLIANKPNNDQVLPFLPSKFRILASADAQAVVDTLTLKVFSSAHGKSLCKLAGNNVEGAYLGTPPAGPIHGDLFHDRALRLRHFLAVSAPAARRILSLCGDVTLTGVESATMYEMLNLVEGKEYYFVFPEGQESIDGFTTKYNTTLLFPRPDMDDTELLRVFTHEIAMSFDQLAKMAYEVQRDSWWEGLAVVFNRDDGRFDYNPNAVRANADVRALRCALRDPSIRYAAAAERAFRFEDFVLGDLGIPSAPAAAHRGCAGSVIHWVPSLPRLNEAVAFEVSSYTFERDCGHRVAGASPRAQDIVQRLALLDRTEFSVAGVPGTMNLCQFLLDPHVGPRRTDLSPGGPRPRGGGWGLLADPTAEQDLLALSQGKPVPPDRVKNLDKFLQLPDLEAELQRRGAP